MTSIPLIITGILVAAIIVCWVAAGIQLLIDKRNGARYEPGATTIDHDRTDAGSGD